MSPFEGKGDRDWLGSDADGLQAIVRSRCLSTPVPACVSLAQRGHGWVRRVCEALRVVDLVR